MYLLLRKLKDNLESGILGGSGTGVTLGDIDGNITGLTGGAATDLDSIATVALDVGYIVVIGHATLGVQHWVLTAGTDAENPDGGIVRPDDFNAATNAKVWVLR